jgi:starch synthase
MKIAFVATEAVPYAKTGGLADVAGSLPKELEKLGCEVKLFIPKYFLTDEAEHDLHYNWDIGEMPIRINNVTRTVHVHQSRLPDSDVEVNFIDCPHYFHRRRIYTDDWDEDERFVLFSKGVIETLQRLQWKPDVIHCNDWQTGLIPLFIKDNYSWDKFFDHVSTLFTIHNIGYQGQFSTSVLFSAEISGEHFYPDGPVEDHDTVSFMKAGIYFTDLLNTVSNKYSHEILKPDLGAGLDGILNERKKDLYGILNGADYDVWNPETDKYLPHNYSKKDLAGKLKNKKILLDHFDMPFKKSVPLIGIVSRMVAQKGFDIFADVIQDLIDLDVQWLILGSGEEQYEELFRQLALKFPEKVGAYIGYNNELSHQIEAGADMFLMPSLYEPCGLNQIYSLKYGTVPIVKKTGGLADTVHDWDELKYFGLDTGTGFTFNDHSGTALSSTVKRALYNFHIKKNWKKIQKNGMKKDYSWKHSAEQYVELYKLAKKKRG